MTIRIHLSKGRIQNNNRIIWVHPSKGRVSKCNCMIKEVEQVTTMDALTTHHEAVNESIVQKI